MTRAVTGAPIGFGCMRLSTAPDRDEARGVDTILAALDAGATLLDTADAYAIDDDDIGHNERLIARALSRWTGDRATVRVATKGGLTRPRGRWLPNGKASHLTFACEQSLRALGVDRIDLYQLHAPDPKVSLATSVRALAALKERGLIAAIGLCNINLTQLEQARAIVDIDAVQVELSWLHDEAIRAGLVEYCADKGIELLAHSPLGGPKRYKRHAKNRVLAAISGRREVEPTSIALAYLRDLSAAITPIPGRSTPPAAREVCAAQSLELGPDDREALDKDFSASDLLRRSREQRAPGRDAAGDVVLIMGMPGAGKSTAARELEARGYRRLNRDRRGGTLAGLAQNLGALLADGVDRLVVDNTYPSRAQRNLVVETAWQHGATVRCDWIDTSIEDAQINAVLRMLRAHGALLAGDELAKKIRGDDTVYLPEAQFRFRRQFERPSLTEGFESVKQRSLSRDWGPEQTERALIVQLADDTMEPLRDVLQAFGAAGWTILGTAWQPGLSEEAVTSWQQSALETLGHSFRVEACVHAEGPARCWCRKPLPGLGVLLIVEERLDPARCIHIGRRPADRTWAQRLGFDYVDITDDLDALVARATSHP